MKQLYLLIIFLWFSLSVNAQFVERFVFNACGNTGSVNGITLRANVGEPIVTKKGNAAVMLSQGFLPGSFEIINSSNNSTFLFDPSRILVYPNPTSEVINFDFHNTAVNKVEIQNLVGQVIISQVNTTNTLDISKLPAGIFIVTFYNELNEFISTAKIIKQ